MRRESVPWVLVFCQVNLTLDGSLFTSVCRHHTDDLVTVAWRQVNTVLSVFAKHSAIRTVDAVTKASVGPDLARGVVPCLRVVWVVLDETLAAFVVLNRLDAVRRLVWSTEQVEVVVLVPIVVHVDPIEGLAVQLREKGIITVLVAFQPKNPSQEVTGSYRFLHS